MSEPEEEKPRWLEEMKPFFRMAANVFFALFFILTVGNFLFHIRGGILVKLGVGEPGDYDPEVMASFRNAEVYVPLMAAFLSIFLTQSFYLLGWVGGGGNKGGKEK